MSTVHTTIFWFLHLWFALPAHPSYPTHKADFSASSTYFLYVWHFSGCQFHIVSKSAHLVLHFLLQDNCYLLYIAETEQLNILPLVTLIPLSLCTPLSHLPSLVSVSKSTEHFIASAPLLTLQITLSLGTESYPEVLVNDAHTFTLFCYHFLHLGKMSQHGHV